MFLFDSCNREKTNKHQGFESDQHMETQDTCRLVRDPLRADSEWYPMRLCVETTRGEKLNPMMTLRPPDSWCSACT
ncbi:hypothetical protein QR680_000302 [Steinernema hermaphroditum]|uniref:Uncharacterized protein n=1 Tax=Steinernema hermaphroditum TaxID=289476 RepID=A0AA39LDD5_9BILA|nr:hypothetical protein QR680_000302 [Steinernema hermaphroditum]